MKRDKKQRPTQETEYSFASDYQLEIASALEMDECPCLFSALAPCFYFHFKTLAKCGLKFMV